MSIEERRRRYLAMMAVCVALIVLAWTVVRLWSTTLAVAMSAIALVIPPFAAIVANRRDGSRRRRPGARPARAPRGRRRAAA